MRASAEKYVTGATYKACKRTMTSHFDSQTAMRCLLGIRGRAERLDLDQIVETFSVVGPLLDLISVEDHQVIFGRRGTGKTHALRYLYANRTEENDCAVFVDMTNLGSDISIYNDTNFTVNERATRLLIDCLAHIQDGLLDYLTSGLKIDFEKAADALDRLSDAISQVRVSGSVAVSEENTEETSKRRSLGAMLAVPSGDSSVDTRFESAVASKNVTSVNRSGQEHTTVRFPQLGASLRDICQLIPARRIWIIFDEWSAIPTSLQPFLADMLKRAFFNLQKVSVKIGAIEHRTRFLLDDDPANPIGLEVTADIRSNLRLDDYLLFDNDSSACVDFFKEFLFRHAKGFCKEKGLPEPESSDDFYRKAFNQKTAFEEFVKAAEGVPRDALHIAANCAQKSMKNLIDVPTVRSAAHRYFQEDKSSQVDENPALRDLLQFIIDRAIRQKRTNSFLLEVGTKDYNVDLLFDRRLVHIRQRNVSSRDTAGARYLHYKIDYGCYVDLVATKHMPREIDFSVDAAIEDVAAGVEVPTEDDARSYRRSILDLSAFYEEHPEHNREP